MCLTGHTEDDDLTFVQSIELTVPIDEADFNPEEWIGVARPEGWINAMEGACRTDTNDTPTGTSEAGKPAELAPASADTALPADGAEWPIPAGIPGAVPFDAVPFGTIDMPPLDKIGDRILETSTLTGTGTFTLAGALTGFRRFSSELSNGDTVPYRIDGGSRSWRGFNFYLSKMWIAPSATKPMKFASSLS